MSKGRSFADQFKIDVERMLCCVLDAGYSLTEDDLVTAWTDYSESLCATWLMLPEENETLLSILLRHIETTGSSRDGSIKFNTTVVDAGDGTGDGIIEIPNELLESLGWREGDVLSVIVSEPAVLVVERLDNRKRLESE